MPLTARIPSALKETKNQPVHDTIPVRWPQILGTGFVFQHTLFSWTPQASSRLAQGELDLPSRRSYR